MTFWMDFGWVLDCGWDLWIADGICGFWMACGFWMSSGWEDLWIQRSIVLRLGGGEQSRIFVEPAAVDSSFFCFFNLQSLIYFISIWTCSPRSTASRTGWSACSNWGRSIKGYLQIGKKWVGCDSLVCGVLSFEYSAILKDLFKNSFVNWGENHWELRNQLRNLTWGQTGRSCALAPRARTEDFNSNDKQ